MNAFHFLRPWWLLALIPAILILTAMLRRRVGESAWQALFDRQLLERLWLEPPGRISRLPLLVLGFGWLLAILALAGPVWERQPQPVWRSQAARVLILDLSASMNTADLAPSRLHRARFKISDILAKTREGRTGLVVFAGESHAVAPLTDDSETIANLLAALTTDIVPAAGDAAAPALQMAGDLLQRAGVSRGELLLLSDGMSDPAAALSVARSLRDRGHRLSVLGVGTVQGAPLPGVAGGLTAMSRLPVATLQDLARTGGGAFARLTADDRDLGQVLQASYPDSALREMENAGVARWIERGVWLLPLLMLLAAAGFRRGWLMGTMVVALTPPPAQAFEWQDLWLRADQQAAKALHQGQPQAAANRFRDPAWRGMALYQSGDYPGAVQAFAQSSGMEADYNRGNALARAGRLTDAAAAYRKVLEQAAGHDDARTNLALMEKLLQKRQQKQQAQEQQQQRQQQQPQQQQGQPQDSQAQAGAQQQKPQAGEDEVRQAREDSTAQDRERAGGHKQAAESEPKQGIPGEAQTQDEAAQRQAEEAGGSTGDIQQSPPTSADSTESVRRDVAQRARSQSERIDSPQSPDDVTGTQRRAAADETLDETELALDQWLRQIPEDPAGLLRRKFMLEHLRRQQEAR